MFLPILPTDKKKLSKIPYPTISTDGFILFYDNDVFWLFLVSNN